MEKGTFTAPVVTWRSYRPQYEIVKREILPLFITKCCLCSVLRDDLGHKTQIQRQALE